MTIDRFARPPHHGSNRKVASRIVETMRRRSHFRLNKLRAKRVVHAGELQGELFKAIECVQIAEELRQAHDTPQVYQFYFHKDRGLNRAMMQRAKQAGVNVMMLTVDSITGGNRERDLRTGFSIPFQLTLGGMQETLSGACPDCGSQLEYAEGCVKCHVCGFSECG